MNERMRLDFVEFSASRAKLMTECGHNFASSKPDGRPGQRHGTVYSFAGWSCLAYWTPSRMVVVREEAA